MSNPIFSLNTNDKKLIEDARRIISNRFKENYHHVGAALRTKSGKIFSAVHLEAHVGSDLASLKWTVLLSQ
jgi:cytidine deaminase